MGFGQGVTGIYLVKALLPKFGSRELTLDANSDTRFGSTIFSSARNAG